MDQTNKQPNPDTGSVAPSTIQLLSDLGLLIDSTRQRVARTVNAELVLMYWKMGARIRQDIFGQERAPYGEQIVSTLSRQSPIGLILCSEKNGEQVELLQLNEGEIRVAEYLTALPERSVLESKLHDAVIRARSRIDARVEEDNTVSG